MLNLFLISYDVFYGLLKQIVNIVGLTTPYRRLHEGINLFNDKSFRDKGPLKSIQG